MRREALAHRQAAAADLAAHALPVPQHGLPAHGQIRVGDLAAEQRAQLLIGLVRFGLLGAALGLRAAIAGQRQAAEAAVLLGQLDHLECRLDQRQAARLGPGYFHVGEGRLHVQQRRHHHQDQPQAAQQGKAMDDPKSVHEAHVVPLVSSLWVKRIQRHGGRVPHPAAGRSQDRGREWATLWAGECRVPSPRSEGLMRWPPGAPVHGRRRRRPRAGRRGYRPRCGGSRCGAGGGA